MVERQLNGLLLTANPISNQMPAGKARPSIDFIGRVQSVAKDETVGMIGKIEKVNQSRLAQQIAEAERKSFVQRKKIYTVLCAAMPED